MAGDISKKELAAQYKEREVIGGVYITKNTVSGKMLLEATADLRGAGNRFEFAQKTGSCVNAKLQRDWTELGADKFIFEVLEELKKEPAQTPEEFNEDIAVLKEIWLEKLMGEQLY
jgi:hypothetical protein